MARAVKKTEKVGWALRINRTGETGLDAWEAAGSTFLTRNAALAYRNRHYSYIAKYTITGIRLNIEKASTPSRHSEGASV
jgi:hypothetical protein